MFANVYLVIMIIMRLQHVSNVVINVTLVMNKVHVYNVLLILIEQSFRCQIINLIVRVMMDSMIIKGIKNALNVIIHANHVW